jgi:succinyl-diaminopimelate desuccinylase
VIDREKKRIIGLCSKAVTIPSENPPGRTTEMAQFLRDYIESQGLHAKIYEPQKDLPNVVATVGSRSGPNLVFNAHMDVYPAETGAGKWKVPLFSGKVTRGRIFGRGVSDMKGGLTSLILLFSIDISF